MLEAYRRELPLLPGAVEAVRRAAAAFPLALASSSNREVFEEVLDLAGIADCFSATVSSEEVARGKPAPDVYLEAARRLGVAPERCAAVEDSHAGIRSAKSAGMRVVAIPNATLPARRRGARARRRASSARSTSSRSRLTAPSRRMPVAAGVEGADPRRERRVEVLAEHREDRDVAQRPGLPAPASRRRSVASSTKPSLRGIAELASLRGSIRISIRSAPQTSKPTRVSAAVDSVASPCRVALARIQ